MKIAYLINHLDEHGGIEKVVAQKINAWIRIYRFEVVLITKMQRSEKHVYQLDPKCKIINLNIQSLPNKQYFRNIKYYISLWSQVREIIKNEKIDVLFSTLTSIDSLLIPFIIPKVPKVLELHHSGLYLHKKSWNYKKKIIAKYNTVVVLNEDEIKYYGLSNITVIPNFTLTHNHESNATKQKIIISAGRLDPIKQFDHMIEIWASLASKHRDWEFHIYGNGSCTEYNRLKSLLEKYNVSNSFKIFSAVDDLHLKMSEASIFVQTSASECFPMVLLEAMNAGLPIIAYNSPNGPKNIISDKVDGLLITLNDKVQFAENLSGLLQSEEKRLKIVHNQKKKITKFSEDVIMEKWFNLVSTLK